ncbi:Cysteine-rich VLP domain-containing protein, partial [Dysosmobacter welbionis]
RFLKYRWDQSGSSAASSTSRNRSRLASIRAWRSIRSSMDVPLLLQRRRQHGPPPQDAGGHGGLLQPQPPGDLPVALLLHALQL